METKKKKKKIDIMSEKVTSPDAKVVLMMDDDGHMYMETVIALVRDLIDAGFSPKHYADTIRKMIDQHDPEDFTVAEAMAVSITMDAAKMNGGDVMTGVGMFIKIMTEQMVVSKHEVN